MTTHMKRVLLVDDEKDFVDCMTKRLQRRGLDCRCVYSGNEAMEIIKEKEFDVVVLDMMLPDTNGNEVLRSIKLVSPDTAVIMLTGHACAAAGCDSMQHGAVDYLLKPVELESLCEKLNRLKPAKASHNKGSP